MLIKRLGVSRIKCNHEYTSADYTSLFIFLFENSLNIYNLYMQCGSFRKKKKESNTFFFVICSWEITCLAESIPMALISELTWEYIVSNCFKHTRTDITFCSMSEGSRFIFLRKASFFRYGSFQVHLQTFRCARPTRKLYFSFLFCEVVKHLLVVVFFFVYHIFDCLFFFLLPWI